MTFPSRWEKAEKGQAYYRRQEREQDFFDLRGLIDETVSVYGNIDRRESTEQTEITEQTEKP